MFKKSKLVALLALATVFVTASPAVAREHEREHHHHRFSIMFGVAPRHYVDGYYDRWGYWHPYVAGYYDRWGYWHPYR